MTPEDLDARGLRVRARGDVTEVGDWPNIVWPDPLAPSRRRFRARCAMPKHPRMYKAFPTRRAAVEWLALRIIAALEETPK